MQDEGTQGVERRERRREAGGEREREGEGR